MELLLVILRLSRSYPTLTLLFHLDFSNSPKSLLNPIVFPVFLRVYRMTHILAFAVHDLNYKKVSASSNGGVSQQYMFATRYNSMEQSDQQFWHIVRSFLIRYNEYNRQKGISPAALEEFDHTQSKMLAQHELKQSMINKLTSMQFKSDYHNLILLAFLMDLAKWSSEYYLELSYHPAPLDAILTQSIQVLNNQQQFHTIVAKQNQLIAALLPLPYTFNHLDQLKTLYRKLNDVKDYFPVSIREHQKKCFLSAVEEAIERASKLKNLKVVEFIFGNIFNELETVGEEHECISQRLKIMKRIAKCLWVYHEEIINKLAYLLMKFSYCIASNHHLYSHLLPIYDYLLDQLLQRSAMTALLVFRHLILNNLEIILKNSSNCILLEGLLRQLAKIFTKNRLEYFMTNYDWNYLEISICQQSLNILYQYCENRAHQKKAEHELVKTYLNRIHGQIKHYLQDIKGIHRDDSKWKFYELKKKQYQELLSQMNNNPKKIFKRIQSTSNLDIKQNLIQKCVRLIKKSSHLDHKVMIDLLASDNKTSAQLFSAYAQLIFKQCKQHNLEQFVRMFTSNFFLTGQSQQIARVLDTITKFYFQHQEKSSNTMKSSDVTYVFANAILILNTDLHNPKNQEKMSEQSFLKMCKKMNDGEDFSLEMLRKTYSNIKKNKINTFRDRGNMLGISVSNWIALCTDYGSIPLSYYDPELDLLDEPCLQYYIHDILSSIIDEKQTAKLELLVERFVYDDKVFECEIIEVMRKVVDKKPHLPLHILEKIFQLANFKNSKPSEKTLSYYWLAANVLATFSSLIPTNIICELLVLTWDIRLELQDNMHLRQSAEIRRIKQCIKNVNKRQSKKSIMDIFSNFLSFKESDDEQEPLPNLFNKRTNFKSISNNVLDILKYKDNHRKLAVQFLISYIHREEAKVYEEFLSCLFLTFNLLYMIQNCQEAGEDLFYELLGVKESSITKRLANLGKKDTKLFNILTSYCRFWILKILLKEYHPSKLEIKENNSYQYMLTKSLDFFQKVDKDVLNDLLKQVQGKQGIHESLSECIEKTIKKVYGEAGEQESQVIIDKFKKGEKDRSPEKRREQKLVVQDKELDKENIDKNEEVEVDHKGQNQVEVKNNIEIQGQSKAEKEDLQEDVKEEELENNQSKQQKPLEPQSKERSEEVLDEEVIKEDSHEISETKNVKKKSIDNLDEIVNPDEMIDKIDREIQSHMVKKSSEDFENRQQNEAAQTSQRKQGDPSEQKPQKEEINEVEGDKQDESPSIPVIMF